MVNDKMKIILASNSPRRRELLSGLGLEFEVHTLKGLDESYPEGLSMEEIPLYISRKKAEAYTIGPDELLITADTIVYLDGEVLGKPADEAEARAMLRKLSGRTHQVVTGVTLKASPKSSPEGKDLTRLPSPSGEGMGERLFSFSSVSQVTFAQLSEEEIDYYVAHFRPLDKAGAYGIQEWIGYIGVTRIEGSYFNVMGLPVQRLYSEMKKLGLIHNPNP
ncbi:MAG: septum formation protein Maf [Bacteroidaceae bacterium]|nr:septum formation protein Maf [Bacteroidaceae bacterium]